MPNVCISQTKWKGTLHVRTFDSQKNCSKFIPTDPTREHPHPMLLIALPEQRKVSTAQVLWTLSWKTEQTILCILVRSYKFFYAGQHNVEAPSRLAKHIVGRRLELSSPFPTPVKYAKPVVLPTADQLSTTPTRGKNGQRQTARQVIGIYFLNAIFCYLHTHRLNKCKHTAEIK